MPATARPAPAIVAHPLADPPWHARLGRSLLDLRDNGRAVIRLAGPWYLGAVLLWAALLPVAQALPVWQQLAALEIFWSGAGAVAGLRMCRRVGLGEPLLRNDFRVYARALLAYGRRLAVVVGLLLGAAATATIAMELLPSPVRTAAVLPVSLGAMWALGWLKLYVTAIALERRDLGLRAAWRIGTQRPVPLLVGVIALYLPSVLLGMAVIAGWGVLGSSAMVALTVAAAALSAALTVARASFFARLLLSLDV